MNTSDFSIMGNKAFLKEEKTFSFTSDVEELEAFDTRLCVLTSSEENNLICVDEDGNICWKIGELYSKCAKVVRISGIGKNLLKAVWANNDIKVIDVNNGKIC